MIDFVALPLFATLSITVAGSRLLDRLGPAAAARSCALMFAAVAVATVPTLWLIGLSGLAHLGFHNPITDWCVHLLPEHGPFGAIIGGTSLIAAIVGTIRVGRVLTHHRRLRCTDTCPVEFVDTDEVYAYTLPGPARTIAISNGLRRELDDREFDLVMAHERVHARHRHDRFKLLALVTTAFIPPVASVMKRLDFYLERWADEEALVHTGAERDLAARTISKVALARTSPSPALGIADHGVAARAAALLRPIEQPGVGTLLQTAAILGATLVLALYQVHHSVMLAAELFR